MTQFTIERVGDPREWSSEKFGGRFLAYPCDLKDSEGKLHVGVEWSRKPDSEAPKVGDTIHGAISGGQHGDRLKVDWDAMKGGGGGSNGKKGDYYKPRDPAEIAGARHAHNLSVAAATLTPLPPDAGPEDVDKRLQQLSYIAGKLDEQTAAVSTEATLAAKPVESDGIQF